jgi:hypothetical protein
MLKSPLLKKWAILGLWGLTNIHFLIIFLIKPGFSSAEKREEAPNEGKGKFCPASR